CSFSLAKLVFQCWFLPDQSNGPSPGPRQHTPVCCAAREQLRILPAPVFETFICRQMLDKPFETTRMTTRFLASREDEAVVELVLSGGALLKSLRRTS